METNTTDTAYSRKWLYIGLAVQSIIIILLVLKSCNEVGMPGPVVMKSDTSNPTMDGIFYTDDSGKTHFNQIVDTSKMLVIPKDKVSIIYKTAIRVIDSAAREQQKIEDRKEFEQAVHQETRVVYIREPYMLSQIDSLKDELAYVKTFSGQYLSIRDIKPKDTVKRSTIAYRYNAAITANQYTKRNKVLGLPIGSKTSLIELKSLDSNATINGLKTYTFKQKQPEFGLRFQASATYNPTTMSFSTGPAMRLDLGRLSMFGAYYYSFQRNVWNPVFNVNLDLTR